jgi:Flp pilus assembly pilin Flp
VPLLLTPLSLSRGVVHNPRVDRAGAERGATAVAYAVMVAIIALLLVGGVFVLSDSIKAALTGGAECVASPGACEGGSGGGGSGGGSGGSGGGGGGGTTTSTGSGSTTTTTTTSTTTAVP